MLLGVQSQSDQRWLVRSTHARGCMMRGSRVSLGALCDIRSAAGTLTEPRPSTAGSTSGTCTAMCPLSWAGLPGALGAHLNSPPGQGAAAARCSPRSVSGVFPGDRF